MKVLADLVGLVNDWRLLLVYSHDCFVYWPENPRKNAARGS